MRTNRLAAAVVTLAALATPRDARAWVVVRAPVYVAPVYVAPVYAAPVYVAPAPVYVPPPPAPDALTTKLPVSTTMWKLPSGCNAMTVNGQAYYQCGVNWMKAYQSTSGTYYGVVPAP